MMMKTLSDVIDEGVHVKRDAVRVIVTPACAEAALKMNQGNRSPIRSNVEYLASLMLSGEWCDDHTQGISFSNTGRLTDGQHRLLAVCKSGKVVLMRVDTGTRDKMREHFDTGAVRRIQDRYEVHEDKAINKAAAEILNCWLRIKCTARRFPLAFFEKAHKQFEPEIRWLATYKVENKGKVHAKGTLCTPVMSAILESLKLNQSLTEQFINSVCFPDGEIQQGRMLREYLIRTPNMMGRANELIAYRATWAALEAAHSGSEIRFVRALTRDLSTIGFKFNVDGK
jgi:hypothetical protein